jgi:tryptophan synthase alpha chain
MSKIEETFKKAEKKEAILVSYITAGDPSIKETKEYASALIEGGTDILELGIPFSDPIADGPVIQAASTRALQAGTRPQHVLACAKRITDHFDIPIVLLSYYNPIFKMGVSSFLKESHNSGVNGLVIPDLPIDEAEDYERICAAHQVDPIFLATPTTREERLGQIIDSSKGFLYLVSVTGVTGERSEIAAETRHMVKKVCSLANGRIPVAVGFGISRPDQVRDFRNLGADGVIVGSSLVRIVSGSDAGGDGVCQRLVDAVREFKKATRSELPP